MDNRNKRLVPLSNGASKRRYRTLRDSPEEEEEVKRKRHINNNNSSSEDEEMEVAREEHVRNEPGLLLFNNVGTSSGSSKPVHKVDQNVNASFVPRKPRSARKRSLAVFSPSSSNVSERKNLVQNQYGSNKKIPVWTSNASSSNPEDLEEQEILEGLLALNPQNEPNLIDPKANSAPLVSCSSTVPFTAVAPKRKMPRPVPEYRTSPISSTKSDSDLALKIDTFLPSSVKIPITGSQNVPPKIDTFLPSSVKIPITGSENGNSQSLSLNIPERDTPVSKPDNNAGHQSVNKLNSTNSEMDIPREEKLEIDLMARSENAPPPPQLRSSPERESDIDFGAVAADAETGKKILIQNKDGKASKRDELLVVEPTLKKAKSVPESSEMEKATMIKERNIDLRLDLVAPDRDNYKSHPHVEKQHQTQPEGAKDEHPHSEKAAQSSSLPMPMSMPLPSWPGGLPPMGYMAPFQGVVSLDGTQALPTPVEPFSQPRPKRCGTHVYIARNIHNFQQFKKMNPFWPVTAGPASLFGTKSGNSIPTTDLHGRAISSVQETGQGLTIFSGNMGKDMDAQRKQQQIMFHQALASGVPPNSMLPGPAFIFPYNQQQAVAAAVAASVRPGPAVPPNATPNPVTVSTPASVNSSAAPAVLSFYPNMQPNETQYLAMLQNNAFSFPIPAPTYRGGHPQPMPFLNGSFYPNQIIHPSQLQHPSSVPHPQIQLGPPNFGISSSSSSSQKLSLQSQHQRPQGTGRLNAFPTSNSRLAQSHQTLNIETEVGNEDSPTNTDNRSSRGPMNVYGQNFTMPNHQNFVLGSSTQASAETSNGNNTQAENKKPQQSQHRSLKPGGVESLPQTFAMSFSPMNSGNTSSGSTSPSVAHNHAGIQMSEADKLNFIASQNASFAQTIAQQRKNSRVPEEAKSGGGDSLNIEEERKGLSSKPSVTSGQSIAFTRSDLTDPSVSAPGGNNVIDNSSRNLNLSSSTNNQRGPQSFMSNSTQLGQFQNMHFQQQQMQKQQQLVQMQQQQQLQQQYHAQNNKTVSMKNGSTYGDHLASSPASKFTSTISGFNQNLVQSSSNNSPSQPSQWKSSGKTTSQVQSSSTSLLKSLPQQQQARPLQNHTQISFGSDQKLQTNSQAPSTNQSSSPPMVIGSPTTSLSKGTSGSPRAPSSNSQGNKASSLSSQQSKNPAAAPSPKSPSLLGNPHNISSSNGSSKSLGQQQMQPQMFFSPASYMKSQRQSTTSNLGSTTSGYFLQRQYPEKQQPSGPTSGNSSPVTLASSSTADAKAGTCSAANTAKGHSQNILHQPTGSFAYGSAMPSGAQVKTTTEQKNHAGNREPIDRK